MPCFPGQYLTWRMGVLLVVCLAAPGCEALTTCCNPPPVPHELSKVTPPLYVIEPPDILFLDAVRLVPKPPYLLGPMDELGIFVKAAVPPIKGIFSVDPSGNLNLGPDYGNVKVAGQTIEEAKKVIEKYLEAKGVLPPIQADVQLASYKAMQQIRGEHLVHRDGTITLGTYGMLHVDGLTIPEVKEAVEAHLANYLQKPEVSVDIGGFNHDVIYVISEGLQGDSVIKLPCVGKETVMDALAAVGGTSQVAARNRIWVARPTPSETGCTQIMQVDWVGVSRRAETATNYQLLPGDRVFIKADPLLKLDATLAKIIAPVERVFGIILLGNTVYRELRAPSNGTGTGVP